MRGQTPSFDTGEHVSRFVACKARDDDHSCHTKHLYNHEREHFPNDPRAKRNMEPIYFMVEIDNYRMIFVFIARGRREDL